MNGMSDEKEVTNTVNERGREEKREREKGRGGSW
jgi:hypothetical protein